MRAPDYGNLSLDSPEVAACLRYGGLVFQAAMLQGFSIECLLKCSWILRGNTVAADGKYKIEPIKKENHDLVEVARAVGFTLSTEETSALAKLSGFTRSFGRYPIAKKWQEQRLTVNEFGIPAGPSWSDDEQAHAEAVLSRLKLEIDTLRQSRSPGAAARRS
jgi:hypothetical protein